MPQCRRRLQEESHDLCAHEVVLVKFRGKSNMMSKMEQSDWFRRLLQATIGVGGSTNQLLDEKVSFFFRLSALKELFTPREVMK